MEIRPARILWLLLLGAAATASGQEREKESPRPTRNIPAFASPYWEKVRTERRLVFGIHRNYPPFAMKTKDGRLIGFDVDLARHMASVLGLERIVFVRPPFPQQIPYLLAGKTDVVIAAMTRTAARGIDVDFSKPYFEFTQGVLLDSRILPAWRGEEQAPADKRPRSFHDLGSLTGLVIGVGEGTHAETLVRRRYPDIPLRRYPDAWSAAEALLHGEVNAVVNDSPFVEAWHALRAPRRIVALTEPSTHETLGIAIRKGDLEFLRWIDLFIDEIRADGTWDRLHHTYFVERTWKEQIPDGR